MLSRGIEKVDARISARTCACACACTYALNVLESGYQTRPSAYPAVNLASLLVMSGEYISDCDELQVRKAAQLVALTITHVLVGVERVCAL
jgi:hypothetical protein